MNPVFVIAIILLGVNLFFTLLLINHISAVGDLIIKTIKDKNE